MAEERREGERKRAKAVDEEVEVLQKERGRKVRARRDCAELFGR